ncbi:MAG: hypothetical protein JWO31_1089 [Phycisphaerales bacterium]|nr:hypothetical protein [Phycisphaerales bacterium]
MMDDPIVAEVRRTREKLLEEAGGDMRVLMNRMDATAAAWPGSKVTLEQFRAERAEEARRRAASELASNS